MEGIVSILVFSILVASITMMLMLAMRITAASHQQADAMQTSANQAILQDANSTPSQITFTLSAGPSDVGSPIEVSVNVFTCDDGIFRTFAPSP